MGALGVAGGAHAGRVPGKHGLEVDRSAPCPSVDEPTVSRQSDDRASASVIQPADRHSVEPAEAILLSADEVTLHGGPVPLNRDAWLVGR